MTTVRSEHRTGFGNAMPHTNTKPRTCPGCGGAIAIGDRYLSLQSCPSGRRVAFHLACGQLAKVQQAATRPLVVTSTTITRGIDEAVVAVTREYDRPPPMPPAPVPAVALLSHSPQTSRLRVLVGVGTVAAGTVGEVWLLVVHRGVGLVGAFLLLCAVVVWVGRAVTREIGE